MEAKEPKVIKTVSDADETEVEKATLQSENEEFTWRVNYNFGNDVINLEKIVLQDDLEDILKVVQVRLVNADGEEIQVIPEIDEQSKKVKIELPKREGSYEYLVDQAYTMHIKSKLDVSKGVEALEAYTAKGGMRNKAEFLLDQRKLFRMKHLSYHHLLGKLRLRK